MSASIFDELMMPAPFLLFLHLQIITFPMLMLTFGRSSLKQQQSNFQVILEVFFFCDAVQKPWQVDSVPRQILFMLTDKSCIPWISGSLRCFLFQMWIFFLSHLSQQDPIPWSEEHWNILSFTLDKCLKLVPLSFSFLLLPQLTLQYCSSQLYKIGDITKTRIPILETGKPGIT